MTPLNEIEKTPMAVKNGMSQAEYDTWKFLSDKEACNEPYTYKIKQSDLTKLIAQSEKRAEIRGKIQSCIHIKTLSFNAVVRNGDINKYQAQLESELKTLEGEE